jgi:hypothetical protein
MRERTAVNAKTKGALHGRVRPDPGVDLNEPVRPGQHGDEGVRQLLHRRMLDRLLPDADALRNCIEELQRADLQAESAERGARRVEPDRRSSM